MFFVERNGTKNVWRTVINDNSSMLSSWVDLRTIFFSRLREKITRTLEKLASKTNEKQRALLTKN